jgi:hypothetical protein
MKRFSFTLCAAALCLSVAAWAERWTMPAFEPLDLKMSFQSFQKVPLTGTRSLQLGETQDYHSGMRTVVQLLEGKRPRWRLRPLYQLQRTLGSSLHTDVNYPALRYEARTRDLVILRCFVRGTEYTTGDMPFALRVSDGSVAWLGEPVNSTPDRPGGPTAHVNGRLYETYYNPEGMPIVVSRRDRDGEMVFYRQLPDHDQDHLVLHNRTVDALAVTPEGVRVEVSARDGSTQTYMLALQDGTLKWERETPARLRPNPNLLNN